MSLGRPTWNIIFLYASLNQHFAVCSSPLDSLNVGSDSPLILKKQQIMQNDNQIKVISLNACVAAA